MKKIEAIIKPFRLTDVKDALNDAVKKVQFVLFKKRKLLEELQK